MSPVVQFYFDSLFSDYFDMEGLFQDDDVKNLILMLAVKQLEDDNKLDDWSSLHCTQPNSRP